MKQSYADVLEDYFGALLDEDTRLDEHSSPAVALVPEFEPELKPALALEPQATAAPASVLPYAEPTEAERRLALEALLAQVAELKEEETAACTLEMPTLTQPLTQLQVLPEPLAEPAPLAKPESLVEEPLLIVEPEPKVELLIESLAKPIAAPTIIAPEVAVDLELEAKLAAELALAAQDAAWRNMDTEHSFQVLFFEVAGMTFAVPLTYLGGIYQVSKLTSLFGKPHWFAGVQTERDRQIYAVDTARWAMPGHTAKEEYAYLVTLGESRWGLGCHQLEGTALLTRDQVKWRATPGARPWLAGMVKEKMCALLHVDALIALLEQGKNIDGQQV
ncbi:chemotaxis protein CheW [Oceanisphaera sp. IT1-181]|uniref:chemotaxis protein CheW n=1 Tax=Oceanisphaera sp. IT1-181 TaxID=3081199 RepID=UPI0029CA6D3E|nr:chemotaxis protein CheW [Oceanisphaera sp. IT1-181]